MPISVSLEPDDAARLAGVQARRGWSREEAANHVLRLGLIELERSPGKLPLSLEHGSLAGQIEIGPDFDDPLPEFAPYM